MLHSFWPSAIVQNDGDRRAHLQTTYDAALSMQQALNTIKMWRSNQTVLCAWIVASGETTPRWFKVYVDTRSNVRQGR